MAALWIPLALWLLSQWYPPGTGTIVTVVLLGFLLSAVAVADAREQTDAARWPRRRDCPRRID